MLTKLIHPAVVLALLTAGCSVSPGDRGGRTGAPPAARPTPSGSPAATTASSPAGTALSACQLVGVTESEHFAAVAQALTAHDKGPSLRDRVAATYLRLAANLSRIASAVPANLRSALTEWAYASVEVARFVARHEPRPGLVVDFGPAQGRWDAARKAAERICAHPLPDD